MKQKTAAIAFLARDCEKTLPGFLSKTERLRTCFRDSRVFIVENGSKDATRTLLKQYEQSSPGVTLHLFDDPAFDSLPRMQRMVQLRNQCLDLVQESQYQPDYYIILDSDLDFDAASVEKGIRKAPEDWAGLFANGRYYLKAGKFRIPVLYYDLFAYLPDCPENTTAEERNSMTETDMHRLRPQTQKAIRKNSYLKCRSAFGGVGIYRFDAIAGCRYTMEKNNVSRKFDYLCEHIPFNRMVSKNGSLYICRGMRVYYEPISFRNLLKARAKDHNRQEELQKLITIYKKWVSPFRNHRRESP